MFTGTHKTSMLINQNSIVTNGLINHLDASNINSYPTSGTLWSDLSTVKNNGTLTNGPTYSTNGRGSIVFDGSNDHIVFGSNPSVTNQITIEVWVNLDLPTTNNYRIIIGRESSYRMIYLDPNQYSVNYIQWVCATTNNGWYTAGTTTEAILPYSTFFGFHQIVGTYDGSRIRLYHDGALQVTSSSNISGNVLTNGTYWIGRTTVTGGLVDYFKGSMSIHRIYNRALSATEILRNFNSQKGRFGL